MESEIAYPEDATNTENNIMGAQTSFIQKNPFGRRTIITQSPTISSLIAMVFVITYRTPF